MKNFFYILFIILISTNLFANFENEKQHEFLFRLSPHIAQTILRIESNQSRKIYSLHNFGLIMALGIPLKNKFNLFANIYLNEVTFKNEITNNYYKISYALGGEYVINTNLKISSRIGLFDEFTHKDNSLILKNFPELHIGIRTCLYDIKPHRLDIAFFLKSIFNRKELSGSRKIGSGGGSEMTFYKNNIGLRISSQYSKVFGNTGNVLTYVYGASLSINPF